MVIETKIDKIKKRDGRIVQFDPQKITNAVFKALSAVKKPDLSLAEDISQEVVNILEKRFVEITPSVEEVQDVVEEVLIKRGQAEVAKAYILYRQQRAELRAAKTFVKAPNDLKLGVNALRVLARRYLLKDDKGNVVETPKQLFRRVAKAVAAGDLAHDPQTDTKKTEEEFYNMMVSGEFMPNTPTLMNAGTDIGQLSACFTSEQPILTKEGFKPISTIRVGEEVVTHKGRLRKVTQVFKRQINEPILKIRVRGLFNETLSVTSEHPVLAAKRDELQCIREKHRLCNGNPSKHCFKRPRENKYDCIYLEKPIATPRWIPAKELEKGDFVAISFNKSISDVQEIRISEVTPEKELILAGNFVKSVYRPNVGKLIPDSIKIDGDFMRLLGYWLADGSLSNRGNTPSTLRFTFNLREEDYCEDVMKIVKDKFNLVARKEIDTLQHTIQLRYHSTVVSQLFETLFGRNFDGKDLPDWVLSLPTDKQFHLLAGLFSGDGCHANRKRHDLLFVSLSNENLARKIWIILNRLGYNFNIRSYDPKLGTKKAFRISAAPSECEELAQVVNKNHFVERKRFPQYIRLGSDVLKPIENVEETEFKGEVYNLEVGEDHSYVANAVAVHNCFVLPVGDSLKEIFDAVKYTTLIQQSGGGTGFSFSRLRPRGDIVMSTKGQASGPVSFMRVFDVATDVVKQGGRRRGANMGILRIDHPDILEFITAKTTEGFLRNFNISVTATDRFMEAVANKEDYELINPRTGQAVRKMNAAEVFDLIIRMNWQTGDPGMVFIDEVNRHNQTAHIGEIESTNPCGEQVLHPYESCLASETRITTDHGLESIAALYERQKKGDEILIATNLNGEQNHIIFRPATVIKVGKRETVYVTLANGQRLRATPDHKILTSEGWKVAGSLTDSDKVLIQTNSAGPLIFSDDGQSLHHLFGWFTGDGWFTETSCGLTFGPEDQFAFQYLIPPWYDFTGYKNKVQTQKNFVRCISAERKSVFDKLRSYGFEPNPSKLKKAPQHIFTASKQNQIAYLQGLFCADGSKVPNKPAVALSSASLELLRGVQLLLLNLGVRSNIKYYPHRPTGRAWGNLKIHGESYLKFRDLIGFPLTPHKQTKCSKFKYSRLYKDRLSVSVSSVTPAGITEVYDISEPVTNSLIAEGMIVHNCNLGSINLAKVVSDGQVDWAKLRQLVRTGVHFLDNVIDVNKFPLPQIKQITEANRRIGLGVMGFAETLIMLNIPYDSAEALEFAEKLMKFIADESHKMSAELGEKRGSFPNFKGSSWDKEGYKTMRNATTTTIAPTGTISIIAQTSSGIEPLFAISFVRDVMEGTKLLETNGLFEKIARERGFYSQELMMDIATTGSVKGNDKVPEDVQRLFATALDIDPEWHVRMQAAFQKYTDNAVSKTINLRPEATPEDIRKAYLLAYKLKCKGITVFRYGSKREQVLYISPELTKEAEREIEYATAESEYAGGCPFFYCPY